MDEVMAEKMESAFEARAGSRLLFYTNMVPGPLGGL